MVTSAANRGKEAEKVVTTLLKSLDAASTRFTFERILDAHSSKGAVSSPRAGDFAMYYKGANYLLEVKQMAHDFRLNRANFPLDQRARMRKRELCGTRCHVLIYSTTAKVWWSLPISYFGFEETSSWDLSNLEPNPDLSKLVVRILEAS